MMKLYDAMISRVRELTRDFPVRAYAYEEEKAWPENRDFEMIFQKDVAFELGGSNCPCVNLTLVTQDPATFGVGDQVLVYGPDLQEIQGDVSYARICEVLVRSDWEERSEKSSVAEGRDEGSSVAEGRDEMGRENGGLKLLQDVEFEKFHVYGKGFMMRTSGQSSREQVRVSKKALQDGITFERMGDLFINHYKKNPNVLAVRVSFLTGDAFRYGELAEELAKEAALAVEIRNSLSKIQKGLPTECSVCEIREICNEVEGLRELHFGSKAGENPASSKKRIF